MSRVLSRQISQIRMALLSGDAQSALVRIDDLTRLAARHGIDAPTRSLLEPALADLRDLAQASLSGAQQAADQVRAIIHAARSLQTYDSFGQKLVTATRSNLPQRF
ncbi:hypothetical protein [Paracoccus sp. JM45]|uniref:hypothetical protein n=1 Tax=Paracoccus sp. JM45 TaxID=2283626 RepID=UPI000E6BE5F0|nr:hypothetical protein [Paracoccus sp. JM45]RJE80893.1 hypothetical protein DWB67_04650 [Paracoccus sp. JM45]